jgi:hypothetical protein
MIGRLIPKRLIKTSKLYFIDPGLAAWLLGIQKSEQLAVHHARGALFETFVVSELLKRRFNKGLEPNLYFWRDRTGNEIDILVDTGDSLLPVEVKSGKTIAPDFFSAFRKWRDMSADSIQRGCLVYAGAAYQDRKECSVIPWNRIAEIPV